MGLVLLVHLGVRWSLGPPNLFGDEAQFYLQTAAEDDHAGRHSLLPGTLDFDHRLRLPSRLFANLRVDGDYAATFRRVEALFITLIVLTAGLVWAQARLLGLGPWTSAGAGALATLFPAQAFHAHAFWPEVPHAFLLSLALIGILAYLRGRSVGWLLAGGVSMGFALLMKSVLQGFLPIVLLFLVIHALRDRQSAGQGIAFRLAAPGFFVVGVVLVIGPQLLKNVSDGHGARLSANRWWNLELGLTPLPRISQLRVEQGLASGTVKPEEVRWLPLMKSTLEYMGAAKGPLERERLARKRTLSYLQERGAFGALRDQVAKFWRTVVFDASCLEQSALERGRWGKPGPAWLVALQRPARFLWWGLLLTATVGFFLSARRSAGWFLVGLLLLYISGTVLLIPMKFRFFLPALLPMSLFAAALSGRRRTTGGPSDASRVEAPPLAS